MLIEVARHKNGICHPCFFLSICQRLTPQTSLWHTKCQSQTLNFGSLKNFSRRKSVTGDLKFITHSFSDSYSTKKSNLI